jgi:hypothetical protein
MKKHLIVLSVILAATCFVACGGGGSPLVGKWKIVEAEGTAAEMNKGTVYEFTGGGKLSMEGMGMKTEFTYSVTNDIVYYSMGANFSMSAKFRIESGKLFFESQTSDQKFVFEKQ